MGSRQSKSELEEAESWHAGEVENPKIVQIPAPPLRPRPRWTEDSFKMLWIRQFAPKFQRIGLDLFRELCSYIEGSAVLYLLRPSHLYIRNVITGMQTDVPLIQEIDLEGGWVCVALPDWRIYVLCTSGQSCYSVLMNGAVHSVSDCEFEHSHPGAVYAPQAGRIYVFGGNSATCERLHVATNKWAPLGDMSVPRTYFYPTLHQDRVYICGGFSLTVDIFDTKTEVFLPQPSLILPEPSDCVAIAKDYKVVVISQNFTCCWDLRSDELSLCCQSGLCPWSIPHVFAVLGQRLFFEVPGGKIVEGNFFAGGFASKARYEGIEEMR